MAGKPIKTYACALPVTVRLCPKMKSPVISEAIRKYENDYYLPASKVLRDI